jgi:hypothetical protein
MAKTLTTTDLDQFTGSETLYRNPVYGSLQYTEGARHVAVAGEAWWLLDLIASYRRHRKVRGEAFQVWTLTVDGNAGRIVCTDGDDHVLVTQDIPFTDFPLETITLWVAENVILLPSEY